MQPKQRICLHLLAAIQMHVSVTTQEVHLSRLDRNAEETEEKERQEVEHPEQDSLLLKH